MKLLDLFCGAGGAAMGYHRAGFDVIVGVDIKPQPNYPFHFMQGDALEPPVRLEDFDLIHASPPCQAYTTMANRKRLEHPALIDATRDFIKSWHRFGVIENVPGARSWMKDPIRLTGEMFGLRVHRPRLFETVGWWFLTPKAPPVQKSPVAVYGKCDGRRLWGTPEDPTLRAWATEDEGRTAMDMDWADEVGLREAIPPAYTEFLGRAFLAQMARCPR